MQEEFLAPIPVGATINNVLPARETYMLFDNYDGFDIIDFETAISITQSYKCKIYKLFNKKDGSHCCLIFKEKKARPRLLHFRF